MEVNPSESHSTREYVLFAWLWTPQDYVGKEQVSRYQKLYKCGRELKLIEVMCYGDCDFVIIDGNHRARAAWENGEPGIECRVLNPKYRIIGRPKRIWDLEEF